MPLALGGGRSALEWRADAPPHRRPVLDTGLGFFPGVVSNASAMANGGWFAPNAMMKPGVPLPAKSGSRHGDANIIRPDRG